MAQGIEFDKEEVIESMKPYFQLGYNRRRASLFVGIHPSTLTKWENADPTLSTKIDGWINEINVQSRKNIKKSIFEKESVNDSWEWISRTEKDMMPKEEVVTSEKDDDLSDEDLIAGLQENSEGANTQAG